VQVVSKILKLRKLRKSTFWHPSILRRLSSVSARNWLNGEVCIQGSMSMKLCSQLMKMLSRSMLREIFHFIRVTDLRYK